MSISDTLLPAVSAQFTGVAWGVVLVKGVVPECVSVPMPPTAVRRHVQEGGR